MLSFFAKHFTKTEDKKEAKQILEANNQ
jgi:hypothetical protein